MFSIVRKVLAIGSVLATTRDNEANAPVMPPPTRQRTRTRSSSLKGMATSHRHALHVLITSAPHVHDVLAAATSIRNPASVPVFVLKHTTTEVDDSESPSTNEPETTNAQDIPVARNANAYGRAYDADADNRWCEAAVNTQEQVWRSDGNDDDANAQIFLQKRNTPKCTAINVMSFETSDLLVALFEEPGTVVWEPDLPGVPYIALTPADETWDEFTDRCSNQPIPQWAGPYLHVPLVVPAFSPFGPTEPLQFAEVIPVFSPSRFAASVCMEQTPLLVQRHAYKAVACDAALIGDNVRALYDDPAVLQRLDELYLFVWTDPAAPLLEMWRGCFMVTIHESENPFAGIPHIVINGTLPNAPWDVEPAVVPEQDESLLTVPMWLFMMELLEDSEEQASEDDDRWYLDSEDDEQEVQYCAGTLSESEESDEARTPSPPSWPILAFPSSTVRNSTRLEDVFEEDENESEVPSVTEVLIRKPWLQDEDDEKEESSPPLSATTPPPATLSTRFNYNSTLARIGETSREATYRPLAANYRPLWTSDARLPVSKDAADDSRGAESGDDQSVYTDALEEQPGETDADHSEDEYRRYRAHDLPRPSCDIFLNTDDDSVKSPVPASQPLPLVLPRGKANIPTGKIDWFDLPDDDLGELDWAVPAGTSAAGNDT